MGMKCQGQTKSQTWFKYYLIDVVLDGRLWYNWTNITDDYSCQRSLTEWAKTEIYMSHQNRKCTWWRISCGMCTQQRRHKSTKKYKQVTSCLQRLSCCTALPWHLINKDGKVQRYMHCKFIFKHVKNIFNINIFIYIVKL